MKTITLDGKEYNLVPVEQEEKQESKTGWERARKNERYFAASSCCADMISFEELDPNDDEFFECGNYRNDEQLNENICRAMRLRLKMLQWQALNDEPIDWHDNDCFKYSIYFDSYNNKLSIDCDLYFLKDVVYFSSFKKAQEALEVFYDELHWYYTEFYRRLDERKGDDMLTAEEIR